MTVSLGLTQAGLLLPFTGPVPPSVLPLGDLPSPQVCSLFLQKLGAVPDDGGYRLPHPVPKPLSELWDLRRQLVESLQAASPPLDGNPLFEVSRQMRNAWYGEGTPDWSGHPDQEWLLKLQQSYGPGYAFSGIITMRDYLARKYAWAIPDDLILDLLSRYGPIVEMGSGTGYWARLLLDRGVDVLPLDEHPPSPGRGLNFWHPNTASWCPVVQGHSSDLEAYGHRTLFLCWPPQSPMAAECLNRYRGGVIAYAGDPQFTADHAFFQTLRYQFRPAVQVPLVRWPGVSDSLFIFHRNRRR